MAEHGPRVGQPGGGTRLVEPATGPDVASCVLFAVTIPSERDQFVNRS